MELTLELLQECQSLGYCNTTSPLVTPAGACKFCRYVLNATLAEWTLAAFYGLDYDQATISPQSLGPSTAPMSVTDPVFPSWAPQSCDNALQVSLSSCRKGPG